MRDRIKVCIGKNKELLECIIVCLLTSFLTFIFFIVRGEGSFTTRADFNLQNIPFTTAMHNAVAEGGFNSFSWNLDLGTSTIQGYSYYNLGSPFFWLSMLFPAASYPYVVGWMYMLKYTVAGCVAFGYLKRFVHNPRLAVIGGVLYAFSGFSATNLMYHFQDMIAFFPLMLIGLECYMDDKKKKGIFIFAVALNALVNYFFFVQSVVFLCIYFLFRFWKKEWKENFKNIGGCMMCGIMGVCLAAPIFIPSVMYILLGNNQNGSTLYINNLVASSASCLATLKAMFFPAELQSSCSAIEQANYSSTAAYLPMVGITFVIAYVRKHRDWLSRILILMFVMSFSPLLSSVFLLFTGFYHRWWMAFVLMMILATVLVLDRAEEYKVLSSAVINGLMVVGMWTVVMFVPWPEGFEPSVFREKLFCVHTGIALVGVILCVIGVTKLRLSDKYMLCCVCIFSILTTGLAIYDYQRNSETGHEYLEAYKLGASLLVHDDQYRYTSSNNMLVFQGEGAGMGCFTSTRSNAIKKFDSYFGVDTDIVSMDKMGIRGCSELLGGKYYVTGDAEDKTALQEIVSNGVTYYVYEREACPIGFSVSSYITESELAEIPVENRGIALLAAALVSDEDADAISGELIQTASDTINFEQSVSDYVTVNSANAVTDFKRDAEGFSCKTLYAEPRYVYFSVPYDNDWTLYIDGEKSEIISSGGMMLVRVPAGEHSLVFEYSTPFYHLGVAMCLGTIVIMAAYEFMHRKQVFVQTTTRDKRGYMMSEKGKIRYLEFLRVLACVAVIVNHTVNTEMLERIPGGRMWFVLCISLFFSKVAVPLYLMVSGTLLLGKVDGYRKCISRVMRIAAVIVIFSLIYYFRDWCLGFCGFKVTEFLQRITANQMTNAYWYLYTYLGIMVMLPLLQRMSINMKKRDYVYLLLVTTVLQGIVPIINHYLPEINYNWMFEESLISVYVGIFFWGYYIANYVEIKNTYAVISGCIFVLCIVIQVAATYVEAVRTPGDYLFFDNRTLLPITLSAAAVFYLAKWLESMLRIEWLWKTMSLLGGMTFGIYLLSDLFLNLYAQIFFVNLKSGIHVMAALLIYQLAIFLSGLLCTIVLKQIPGLKKLL